MRVCGIEISGSEARLVIVEKDKEGGPKVVTCETKKIVLADDRSGEAMRAFKEAFQSFVRENGVQTVCIKERAKKGPYAGGPVSFKIEALIQLATGCDIRFVSPQALAVFNKKNFAGAPHELAKYLTTAFSCAACVLDQG